LMEKKPNPEKLIYEARARITWGDPPDEVRDWLNSEGLDSMRTDEILNACMADRAAAVRKRAITEIVIGTVLLVLAGSGIAAIAPLGSSRGVGRAFALMLVLACYGLFRLLRGLGWMASGANVHGDVSKLGEGWFF